MEKKFYFTMIVYVDMEEMLEQALRSIYAIPVSLTRQIKLIIVDPKCSDKVQKISNRYLEKYNNCLYLPAENASIAEAYNLAIPEIRGYYVNFSLASTRFETGALACVQEIAEERERPKLISLAPWTVNEKGESVPYMMSPAKTEEVYENIRFYQEPERLQLMFHAYFIRTFLINDKESRKEFNTTIHHETTTLMLLELLAEWRGYVYLPDLKFYYTIQQEDNTSVFEAQYERWWYIDALENWILPFEEKWAQEHGQLDPAIKNALLYLIFSRYNCNYNDRSKGTLDEDDIVLFRVLTGMALSYIDYDTIFRKPQDRSFSIPRSMRMLLMRIKAELDGDIVEVVEYNDDLYAWIHKEDMQKGFDSLTTDSEKHEIPQLQTLIDQNQTFGMIHSLMVAERNDYHIPHMVKKIDQENFVYLGSVEREQVILNIINYQDGILEIDGTFSLGDLIDKENIHLKVTQDGYETPVTYDPVYGLVKVFGYTYHHKYNFHVSIPAFSLTGQSTLHFVSELNEKETIVRMRSSSVYSHLSESVKGQYWNIDGRWGLNIARQTELKLSKLDSVKISKKEQDFIEELSKRAEKGDLYAKRAIRIREMYHDQKTYFGVRRIWITFDKLYKAGDNGEYIYHYVNEQNDGIEIFYMIKEDSPDYMRLKKEGANLLVWGTDQSLVTILYAEAILTTHTNVISYSGFDKPMIPYICDLFNPVNICIQHGLTTQDIAQFQNRLFDNLQLYLCASPNEIANISRPIYGYKPENLVLTGVARYDGLKNNDQRQILITPTWRRNIVNSNIAHFKKGYNENFKHSAYFDLYNKLINDPELIQAAKKHNYRIIYLLHPAVSAQIDDFDRNDYVELMQGASDLNYEKILTESSLMVTDYSGVQFDFAYQKKPILYYHPSELPPHYDQSNAYQYDRDAFGPVIDNHEELIQQLCEYMATDCQTKPEYIERSDRFFAFHDFHNAERIYQAIMQFLK